jgi:hypothetical protein
MKRRAWVAMLIAGCGAPGGDAKSPTPPNQVVAVIDGQPVLAAALLESTLATDYKGAVERHAVRLLSRRRVKELGIEATADELALRARVSVARLKQATPPGLFEARLKRDGVTEEQFAERLRGDPRLGLQLDNEKAVVYELLSAGFSRADLLLFGSQAELDRFGEAPGGVQPRLQWRNVRVNRAVRPSVLPEEMIPTIAAADPSDPSRRAVRAVLPNAGGVVLVTVHEQLPGSPGASYAQLKDRILTDILEQPPREVELWLQVLLQRADVRYDRRFAPPE